MSEKILNYLNKILDSESVKLVIKSFRTALPLTLRTNSLKISPSELKSRLEGKGFKLSKADPVPDAFSVVEEPFLISKTIEHFAGLFYIQSLSSMLPPLILEPSPGELILDIASAPGSKTTYIAQLMDNKGIIIANDVSYERLKVLTHQVERLGVINTGITQTDGNRFGSVLPEIFDCALVDAPCSSLGIISKANEVLNWWNFDEVRRLSNKQQQLLSSAIKSVKPGGIIVYSTCTLTAEENEMVIDFAIKKFPVEVEEISYKRIDFSEGLTYYDGVKFDDSLRKTIRIYPFISNTEGFFIAKLRKKDSTFSKSPTFSDTQVRLLKDDKIKFLTSRDEEVKKALAFLSDEFGIDEKIWENFAFHFKGDELWFSSIDWIKFFSMDFPRIDKNLRQHILYQIIQRIGIKLAKQVKRSQWKISTSALQILSPFIRKNIIELENEEDAKKFLNGWTVKNLSSSFESGSYIAVKFDGLILGCGLITKEGLKSQIPKGRRSFEIEVI